MRKVLLGTVFGLAGLLMSASAWADNGNNDAAVEQCGTRPTCKQMGFIYTEDECKGYFALRCPWDASKVACDCTFKYMAGSSNGDITSPSCKRLGVTYYRDPCPGVLASECTNGSTIGSVICTDATGNKYYASCSDEKVCEVGDLLYSNKSGDKKCFPGVAMTRAGIVSGGNPDNYTAIGVVFDATNHLAIALDENRGSYTSLSYGDCDPCGLRSSANMSYNHARNSYSCYKGVAFYNHCKLDDHTRKMNVMLYNGYSIAGADSNADIDAYNATLSVLSNTKWTSSFLGLETNEGDLNNEAELLASFPAIKYCYDYSTIGTQSGINTESSSDIGNWVLPTARDWETLNSNFDAVNGKLALVSILSDDTRNNLGWSNTNVKEIAAADSVILTTKMYTSDRKYWTSNLKGGNSTVWETKYGFKRYKYSYIFDFAEGTSYPVPSTRHSVRARCMIKYAD